MSPDELHGKLAELAREGRRFVLALVVDTSGSSPQKPGARLALVDDGRLLGTIGGGAIEKQILDAAQALLDTPSAPQTRLLETHLTRDLGMCCGGKMTVFLERHEPAAMLWLFGAGHVNRALAAAAADVGFRVSVIDEREEWLTPERFPRANRIQEDPKLAARRLDVHARDLVAVATHDHAIDEDVLVALAGKPMAYLGCIGSARKAIRFRERLSARGLAPADIERMQMPMGLDIGAQSPEEIAIAIVAELIRARAAQAARANGPRVVKARD